MTEPLRRIAFLSTCALIWVFSGAAQCMQPGDDDDDDNTVVGMPLAEFASKMCAKAMACEPTHGRMFASQNECESMLNGMFGCSTSRGQRYDPERGETCANGLPALDCDALFGNDAPPGCEEVFDGDTVGQGQLCEEASCGQDLFCDYSVSGNTCVVCQPKATAGQACGTYDTPCASGLYCNSNDQCAALLALDASCTDHEECGSGFCQQGSCKTKLARDASCTSSDLCVGQLTCISGVCSDAPVTGESCAEHDCANNFPCENDVCVLPEFCPQPTPVGQDCSTTYYCVDGAYCAYPDYTCQAYLGLGDDCSDYTQSCDHDQAYCDWSANPPICKARLGNGESCSDDDDCLSGYCGDSNTCAAAPACTMP